MVDLSNIKKVKFEFNEMNQLRASIGLGIGISLGLGATIVFMALSTMAAWYKAFVIIGVSCAFLLQLFSVIASIIRLKGINKAMEEFRKMTENTQPADYHG